jgi:hypothetical protein
MASAVAVSGKGTSKNQSTPASLTADSDSKDVKINEQKKASDSWLKSLYNIKLFTSEDLKQIYDQFRYHGFDRDKVLFQLEQTCGDPRVAVEIIILCAMRGPQAASLIKLRNGKTPADYKIPASGQQGTDGLSCQRITAATADLAAYYLKTLNIPKRLPTMECPGWLQFPSAGSIKLPSVLRQQHIDFSKKFSTAIGGVFNESIYGQMEANAYLDDNLGLFE